MPPKASQTLTVARPFWPLSESAVLSIYATTPASPRRTRKHRYLSDCADWQGQAEKIPQKPLLVPEHRHLRGCDPGTGYVLLRLQNLWTHDWRKCTLSTTVRLPPWEPHKSCVPGTPLLSPAQAPLSPTISFLFSSLESPVV